MNSDLSATLPAQWRIRALICLTLLHTLVDAAALLIAPLWPTLNEQFQFSSTGLTFAFIVQALPTSLSQAIFGVMRDRLSTPLFLWSGPLVAILFLSLVGFPSQFSLLCLLLIVGGTGVGAFHPEAAVTASRIFPELKTRALSIFLLGGTLGLCLGPLLSGFVVEKFGIKSLIWLIPPFVVAIFAVVRFGHLITVAKLLKQESEPSQTEIVDETELTEPAQETPRLKLPC
ncbi:MAG: MFS transporter [Planctomycetaceae bacterium]